MLVGPVKQGFTIAVEAFEPGFHYAMTPEEAAHPTLFEFSFLARRSGSSIAGPLYVSLIWVEGDKNWALNRLVADNWLRMQTVF
jgi:hypothetical protein